MGMPLFKIIFSFAILLAINIPLFSQTDSIDHAYQRMIERKYDGFPTLSTSEAQKKLHTSVLFLDTRSQEEYNVSHLPRALFIDYDQFNISALDSIKKNTEIIVYCSIGVRSQEIGKQLKDEGFTNVKNLYGGIFLWADQGRIMHNLTHDETRKVHGYNKFWGRWVKKAKVVYSD